MTKGILSTREKIIEKALYLFNRDGIEYVGVRELAKELDMKGGNITYYFPTKDDLVREIALSLSALDTYMISDGGSISIVDFLDYYYTVFSGQYKYRSFFLSLPHLLIQNKALAEVYHKNQEERIGKVKQQLEALSKHQYIRSLNDIELQFFTETIIITGRFWIQDAVVDRNIPEDGNTVITQYVGRLKNMLTILATPKGMAEIAQYDVNK
jgi:AcrR family transcriptional regulator